MNKLLHGHITFLYLELFMKFSSKNINWMEERNPRMDCPWQSWISFWECTWQQRIRDTLTNTDTKDYTTNRILVKDNFFLSSCRDREQKKSKSCIRLHNQIGFHKTLQGNPWSFWAARLFQRHPFLPNGQQFRPLIH